MFALLMWMSDVCTLLQKEERKQDSGAQTLTTEAERLLSAEKY